MLGYLFVLTSLAWRLRLLDLPDHRKRHDVATPCVGGLALYLTLLTLTISGRFEPFFQSLVLSTGLIVLVGLVDDIKGLSAKVRLSIQACAVCFVGYWNDSWIYSIGTHASFSFDLWLAIPFTIFSVVGLTNAFNMVDGLDGLAAGHALLAISTLWAVSFYFNGQAFQALWFSSLCAILVIFLFANLGLMPGLKAFLGDAGSNQLGFLLGFTLIYYTQNSALLVNPVVALWCVTLPVWDTLCVALNRIKVGKSPFTPDRTHLHHQLVDGGMRSHIAVTAMLTVSLVVNISGVVLTYVLSPAVSLVIYGLSFSMFLIWRFKALGETSAKIINGQVQ